MAIEHAHADEQASHDQQALHQAEPGHEVVDHEALEHGDLVPVGAHGAVEHHEVDHSGDPERWGLHMEFGRTARRAGWIVVVLLLLLIFVTHYNDAGQLALILIAGVLVVMLLWDRQRRRNSWRG